MRMRAWLAAMVAFVTGTAGAPALAADPDTVARGRYLFHAAACDSCHTDHEGGGAFLAGGKPMETPFGLFHPPNITPDPETGIGRWSAEDFRDAMIHGVRPDGAQLYPVFPYRWYTGMAVEDIDAIKAYLDTVPPVRRKTPDHDLTFPFSIRPLVLGWKLLNFDREDRVADPNRSPEWNRGAYLVNHVGHCGACHTAKVVGNFVGWMFLAGSGAIPGPLPAPNITPHPEAGIGRWSDEDIVRALKRSMKPDGTPIRGPMAEYVVSGSSRLTDADLRAIAVYLRTVEPEDNRAPGEDAKPQPPQDGNQGRTLGSLSRLMAPDGGLTRAK